MKKERKKLRNRQKGERKRRTEGGRGGGGKGRRRWQKQHKKTKVLQKSKFCLDGFVGCWKFGWLAGQLVRWFVADSLPDFRNVKRPYIQCHFQLAVAHYDWRVFWIKQFLSLNASLQSKQNLKLKVHENLLWWVGVLDMAAASCVAYFFPFPLFISLSLLHSCSLSLSLVLSYLNLKTCIFSMQPAGYKCYNFQN